MSGNARRWILRTDVSPGRSGLWGKVGDCSRPVADLAKTDDVVGMSQHQVGGLEAAFQNSQSGKGIALDDVNRLKEFAAYTRTRDAVVCNVETFEVRGDDWITRTDLSIYQGGAEEQALPSAQRIALSEEALQEVLDAIEYEGVVCRFQVWTDALCGDELGSAPNP